MFDNMLVITGIIDTMLRAYNFFFGKTIIARIVYYVLRTTAFEVI